MAGLAAISAVVGLLGTVVSAAGTIAQGKAAEAAADFQAEQLKIKGKEERAASQRAAEERKKEAGLVNSRIQAGAAASGAGAGILDTSVVELASDVAGRGEYGARMERYTGEERKQGLDLQAESAKMSGDAAKQGAMFSALGTIVGGVSSFASKYSGGGFQPTAQAPFDPLKSGQSFYSYG